MEKTPQSRRKHQHYQPVPATRSSKMHQLPVQAPNGDNFEPMELDLGEQEEGQLELQVLEDVNLDLESYICHYHGLPRIYRLEFIADHCRSLRVEALTMAIDYIKEHTYNVKDYIRLFKKLQEAREAGQMKGPVTQPDTAWIDLKKKQAGLRFERLESDLKNFRSNSMKENIRRGQDDLGDHFLDCGELELAFSAYSKSRDYASTHRNQINQCLNMIRVGILLKRWLIVSNHVLRAQSQPSNENPPNPSVATKLACAAGLFELHSRKYKKAAKCFLTASFDHFNQPSSSTSVAHLAGGVRAGGSAGALCGPPQAAVHAGPSSGLAAHSSAAGPSGCGPSSFTGTFATNSHLERDIPYSVSQIEILAPINIAVYGSLCALATYSRQELSNQLINSASFKQFAELEPQLREAVARFYESKYASCLSILNEIKNVLLLDMYLAPHIERLYRMIRNKALIQYFEPYSTANMYTMAAAFNTTVADLEREIVALIYDGQIKARIDSYSKILYAKMADQRTLTFERAIKMGKTWQRQTQALISRTAILNAGLAVNATGPAPNNPPDRAAT